MVVKIIFMLTFALLLVPSSVSAFEATLEQDQLVEQGVAFYNDNEFEKAKAILLPLAEIGHPKAMNIVGLMHNNTGVFPNDPRIACDWYEKAANAGYPSAMYNMSNCYNDGIGRPKDPETDKHWLLKAADNGYTPAMIILSSLDKSEGEEYRYWMNMAREHGSVYAKVSLYLQGYAHDVPDLYIQDKVCVYVRIIILGGDKRVCD
ncbi:MAG: sel1 repeat family protein [Magnetovibrio sp.]|nr:sel1 repeat family protein [Magnetovibrio sp.]